MKEPAAASSSCMKRPASAVVPGPDDVSSESLRGKKTEKKGAEEKKPADKKDSKNIHCHRASISCI